MRETGAAVTLITDGDVAGVIHTADPEQRASTSIWASAARPRACWRRRRCAASAGRCRGGCERKSSEQRARAEKMGIKDFDRKLTLHDMASGDVMFAATGVTDGSMLRGVRFGKLWTETETVVMRSATGTMRWIRNRKRIEDEAHV